MPGRSERLGARSPAQNLLQGSAYVVDSIFRMVRIHDFEDHVVACFQACLTTASNWSLVPVGLLVDAGNDESRLETLQIGEGAGTHGLDDHAGGVDPGGDLIGDLAHDEAQLFRPASLV